MWAIKGPQGVLAAGGGQCVQDKGHNGMSPNGLRNVCAGKEGYLQRPGEGQFYYLKNFQRKNILWDWGSTDVFFPSRWLD